MSGTHLPESVIHTLANGMEILVVPEYASPVVSVQAWVKVGSVHEGRHLGAGIAHLLEHLVFKGTRSFGASEAARVVQDVGGHLNAYTGFERTVYWIDAPEEGLGTALDVTTELVFHPRFPEEEFEREKDVIRREIAMGKDDPGRVFSEELFATAFRVHPCRNPVIGHLGAFNKLTLDDVRAFHATHYVPNNVFFVVSGAVDPAAVVAMLGERTGKLDPAGRAADVLPVEPALTGPRRREFTFATDVGRLQLAWHIPAQTHPDIPALDVLGRILGAGESSRLYRRLREDAGLAHEIGAGIFSPGFAGVFHVGGEADPGNLAAMEHGIRGEIDALVRDGVSEAELEKARCGALVDFLRGLESTNGLARQIGASWLLAHSTDYPARYLDGLHEVAAEKVRSVAERYLSVSGTMMPPILSALTTAHANLTDLPE
jgi:zinc protease